MRMLAKCERWEFLSNAGRRRTLSGRLIFVNVLAHTGCASMDDGGEEERIKINHFAATATIRSKAG